MGTNGERFSWMEFCESRYMAEYCVISVNVCLSILKFEVIECSFTLYSTLVYNAYIFCK